MSIFEFLNFHAIQDSNSSLQSINNLFFSSTDFHIFLMAVPNISKKKKT